MKYWWVNQNATFRHEIHGSYLWSPKRTADGRRNQFYDNMQFVSPGDVVFSFADTYVKAIGIVDGPHMSALKPAEFGAAGRSWSDEGWFVPATFHKLRSFIRPKDFMEVLSPHLPAKYSPLQHNGNGNQGVYLASVPEAFATALFELLGTEGYQILSQAVDKARANDASSIVRVLNDPTLSVTQRTQIIQARIGQGLFRSRVAEVEQCCRITGVTDERFLIASHIKPWSASDCAERLDGYNGLFLTPNIDRLFDRGLLTFEDDGVPRFSDYLPEPIRVAWLGSGPIPPIALHDGQKPYMAYHRERKFGSQCAAESQSVLLN